MSEEEVIPWAFTMLAAETLRNFCRGSGSVLILSPNLQKLFFTRRCPIKHSDIQALQGDWEKVGQDLWYAFKQEQQNVAK